MAWGELKSRNVTQATYPTLAVSAWKITNCKMLSLATGLPFILFVEYSDGIFAVNLTERLPDYVAVGGRTDRGDVGDIEPLCHYDKGHLKFISQRGQE